MSPSNPTNRTTSFRVGWLIDGSGGPIQTDMLLQVVEACIHAVRPYTPEDGRLYGLIDWSQDTVLPGLVDSHVHLFMSGTSDPDIRQKQLTAGYPQTQTVIAKHLAQHLACGVVAVRDGGDRHAHVLRYKSQDPRLNDNPVILQTAGKAWRQAGRYGKLIGRAPGGNDSLADAIGRTASRIDHVKIVNSGLNSLTVFAKETTAQFQLPEMTQAVKACRAKGLPVMVHANGKLPVKIAVEAGCTSIEHGFFMGPDNLQRMAARKTFWVPTGFTMQGYAQQLPPGTLEADMARRNLEDQLRQLAMARELGVRVALGTDAGSLGVHHGTAVREELGLLMQAGYSLQEAIRCATRNGAVLSGLSKLGKLTTGMSATFLAVTGGPSNLPGSLAEIKGLVVNGHDTLPGTP